MNLTDLVIILLAALLGWRGYHRGALRQTFEFGFGFLGLLVGAALGPRIVREYTDRAGVEAALLSLLVIFVALSIGQIIGYLIGIRFGELAKRARLGEVDSTLGAVLGGVATFIGFWLIGSLLVQGPSRPIANQLSDSAVLRWMNGVRTPPDLLAYLQKYLDTSGFPQVFAGVPPPISEPVDLPSERKARQASEAADQSTLRIVVPACGGTQLGTGWVAAPDTVVTNAHVVAGGDRFLVEEQDTVGEGVAGTVVLFDDRIDIAVIHIEGVGGPPLPLTTESLEPGSPGATLGYPGNENGQLVAKRAAVQNEFRAVGRDIYGRQEVARNVYELRGRVRQGDSGGPFVTPAGKVAGVVFAASTTNTGTGYALTGAEVQDEIREGATRTERVATGSCTH